MSVNMAAFTAPKSDQLNADDLIAGTRTITVTGVRANEGSPEQPVSISFEGDDGKPYKPCKSMRRVMVHVWGPDAKTYIGRAMTLYCDPNVQFGGMKVGGIRISHMSHMEKPQTMALTTTRSKRAPYVVQPLIARSPADEGAELIAAYEKCADQAQFSELEQKRLAAWQRLAGARLQVKAASDAARKRIEDAAEAVAATGGEE
jgi:hypothetical protein